MANEKDRDDLDRNPSSEEEVRGAGDDEFEDADEGDEEDLEDDTFDENAGKPE
jgi:hypothetical protein